MNFSKIFEETSKNVAEKNKGILEKLPKEQRPDKEKELKSKHFWRVFSLSFSKYIARSITGSIGGLKAKAEPLSLVKNKSLKDSKDASLKMLPESMGGPSQKKIYESGLYLAKKLSLQEKHSAQKKEPIITPFSEGANKDDTATLMAERVQSELTSFNVSGEETAGLSEPQQLELLQRKTLEREIKNPEIIQEYTNEKIDSDLSVLQRVWDQGYEDMYDTSDAKKRDDILDKTASGTAESLERYIAEHSDLSPEEKFFISLSIERKKFKENITEALTTNTEEISDQVFERFTDTNVVPAEIISSIAETIKSQKLLSKRQIAIYTSHPQEVEKLLRS